MKRFVFGLVAVAMSFATTTCAPAPPAPQPVDPDWTVEVTAVPASDQTAAPASSAGSNSLWVRTRYYNYLGMVMLTFEMTQYWSWAGGIVTSAPPPSVKGSVGDVAHDLYGWRYKGVIDGNDYFYDSPAVAGTNNHSGHASWRKGLFNNDNGDGTGAAKSPTIGIRVNAHGGWNYTVNR